MPSVITTKTSRTGPNDTIPTTGTGMPPADEDTPAGSTPFKITFNDAGDAILFNATDAILYTG